MVMSQLRKMDVKPETSKMPHNSTIKNENSQTVMVLCLGSQFKPARRSTKGLQRGTADRPTSHELNGVSKDPTKLKAEVKFTPKLVEL